MDGAAPSSFDRSATLGSVRRRVSPERVLATVLFTDIVGSTELAVSLGDRRGATSLRPITALCERS